MCDDRAAPSDDRRFRSHHGDHRLGQRDRRFRIERGAGHRVQRSEERRVGTECSRVLFRCATTALLQAMIAASGPITAIIAWGSAIVASGSNAGPAIAYKDRKSVV